MLSQSTPSASAEAAAHSRAVALRESLLEHLFRYFPANLFTVSSIMPLQP